MDDNTTATLLRAPFGVGLVRLRCGHYVSILLPFNTSPLYEGEYKVVIWVQYDVYPVTMLALIYI